MYAPSTSHDVHPAIRAELSSLGRQVRRLRLFSAGALALGLAAATASFQSAGESASTGDVVRARRFEVVDNEGVTRAVLGLVPHQILTSEGARTVDQPTLHLNAPDGAPRYEARVGARNLPSLYLFDDDGHYRVMLDFWRGEPGLELLPASDNGPVDAAVGLGVEPHGGAFLNLFAGRGFPFLQLRAWHDHAALEFTRSYDVRTAGADTPPPAPAIERASLGMRADGSTFSEVD